MSTQSAKCRYCRADPRQVRLFPVLRHVVGKGNKPTAVCQACFDRNRTSQDLRGVDPELYLRYCARLGLRTRGELMMEQAVWQAALTPFLAGGGNYSRQRDPRQRATRVTSVTSAGLPSLGKKRR